MTSQGLAAKFTHKVEVESGMTISMCNIDKHSAVVSKHRIAKIPGAREQSLSRVDLTEALEPALRCKGGWQYPSSSNPIGPLRQR